MTLKSSFRSFVEKITACCKQHKMKLVIITSVAIVFALIIGLTTTYLTGQQKLQGGNAFVTFYGFNDNDNGKGSFGTNVIAASLQI